MVAAVQREAIPSLKSPSPALPSLLPGLLHGAASLGVAASLLLAPPAVHAKTVSGLTSDVTVVGVHACISACPCATCPCAMRHFPSGTACLTRYRPMCSCLPMSCLPMCRLPSACLTHSRLMCFYLSTRCSARPPRRHLPMRSLPMRSPSHALSVPCTLPPLQYDGAGIIAQEKETQLSKELAELERWVRVA